MSKLFKLIRVPQDDGSGTRSRKNPSPLIHIQVLINTVETRTMVDTGSTISAIDAAYVKKLNLKQYIYPTTTACKTANNGHLHISGMIVLPITINNIQLQVNTFVVKDLCTDLLLGGDFCDKYRVNINYGSKYLTINIKQQQFIIKFQQHVNEQQVFNIKTMNNVIIPPLSAKIIQATTTAPAMCAIFTPSSKQLNKQHIAAPHSLLMINNNKTTILTLLNTTSTTQTIPKGTNLLYHYYDVIIPSILSFVLLLCLIVYVFSSLVCSGTFYVFLVLSLYVIYVLSRIFW